MTKKQLKEVYSIRKKIDHLFTGDHIGLDRTGQLLLSPCGTCFKFIDIRSCQIVDEISSAKLNLDDKEELIVTFGYESVKNNLIISYSSGLLRQWSIQIENQKNEENLKVEHVLLRSWKSLHIGPIAKIRFDTTGTLVATCGSDGIIKLWDIVQMYCTHNFKEAKGVINTVAFAPNFNQEVYHLLASGDDYAIHVWNLIDSKHLAKLDGHQSKITEIMFTSNDNGKRFISSSRDQLIIIWNAQTFYKERTMAVFESVEAFLLVSAKKFHKICPQFSNKNENLLVMAGESGLLKIWDYRTGNMVYGQSKSLLTIEKKFNDNCEEKSIETQYTQINQLIYNPIIDQIVATSFDKDILFYDVSDLNPSRQLVGSNDEVLNLKFIGPNQTHIAVATNSPKIKVFDLETLNCFILTGHSDLVLALAIFQHDPCLMVSSSKDNTVRLWRFNVDCKSAVCVYQGTGHTHSVNSIQTSINVDNEAEQFFLSGSEDTTLKYWRLPKNLETSQQSQPISIGQIKSKYTQSCHDKTINSIDVSPNNKLVATGSQDKTAKLWALPNLKLLGVFRGHRKGIWCVKFSPVDQILATGSSDCTIKIWSITNMNCLKTFQGHLASVLNLSFIDEGMQFITSSSDGNLKIWNLKTNECTATFDAHDGKVWAMDISNDEKMLVTGADDSLISLWQDITKEVQEKEALKSEIIVQNEQTLQNLLQRKSWFKALKLAIKFNHPLRCLNILKEIILENGGGDDDDDDGGGGLNSVINDLHSKLRQDQLLTLMEYSIHWNTNSKHWLVANIIIRSVFEQIPPEELLKMPDMRIKVEKLLPYCDRHLHRIDRLRKYITFADFVYEQMKLPDQ